MARDHTRVNLDIWGDDDFLELPVDAQALYWRLWTSPALTFCGAHEWHPGKLAQSAGGCFYPPGQPKVVVPSHVLSVTNRTDASIANGPNQLHMGRACPASADQLPMCTTKELKVRRSENGGSVHNVR